jgi:hypothetical protein
MIGTIVTAIYSVFWVIILNFVIVFKKMINKKKVIFFYHPKKDLTEIHHYYINNFLNNFNNYNFFYASKNLSKKFYYIKESFLKLIFNVDIFISNNISNNFTNKSIKIYMHHDIYDTPPVNRFKEVELRKRLMKYDYIFLASEKSNFLFNKFFSIEKKPPKLIFMGFYPKLNYLLKNRINNNTINTIKIVIAPTNLRSFPNFSIYPYLDKILLKLIENKKNKIIFRPHPSNILEKKVKFIFNKYKKYKNFYFDTSANYIDSYKSSNLLITDMSGTAYTYSLFLKNPVIFYSPSEDMINKSYYKFLNYFRDRNKIGFVVSNLHQLNLVIKKSLNNKFKKKIRVNVENIYKNFFSTPNFDIFKKILINTK